MVGFFHVIINKRNSSLTFQRYRRMSCRPNPCPDSAKVWLLLLPFDLSLHTLRFIHGLLFFFNRGFLSISFPSISRLSTTPKPVLPTIHNPLICVLFRLSISSMLCTHTYLHICLCARLLPTKPTIFFNGICFKYMSRLNLLARSITFPFS